MTISCFKQVYIETIQTIIYVVTIDGKAIWETSDYLSGVAACVAWRRNNPREDKKRVKLHIKSQMP